MDSNRYEIGESYRPGWVPTLDELRAGLSEGAETVRRAVASMADDAWEEARYEGGWNARELLAHVASIEWTYPRLIDIARSQSEGGEAAAAARDGVHGYNARQVEKRAAATPAELLEEFESNRAKTLEAVDATEPELWQVEIESAFGFRGPLLRVFYLTAVEHVRLHAEDLLGSERATG